MKINMDAYIQKNPSVWEMFKKYSEQSLYSGRKYFSARTIIERIRWDTEIAEANSTFKVSDHVSPYFARKLMAEDERFVGFFRLKTQSHEEPACPI